MQKLPNLQRLLKVQAVPCVLQHDYVVIRDAGQDRLVVLCAVEDLFLERLGAIEHQTGPGKSTGAKVAGEAIDVLLVGMDSRQVDLKGAVWLEVEEEGGLEHGVIHVVLDLLDGLLEGHAFKAAHCDRLLNHFNA